jgi:hypothetical protein
MFAQILNTIGKDAPTLKMLPLRERLSPPTRINYRKPYFSRLIYRKWWFDHYFLENVFCWII